MCLLDPSREYGSQLDTDHVAQVMGRRGEVFGGFDEVAGCLDLVDEPLALGLPCTIAGVGAEGVERIVDVVGLAVCLDLESGSAPGTASLLGCREAPKLGEQVAGRVGLQSLSERLAIQQRQSLCGLSLRAVLAFCSRGWTRCTVGNLIELVIEGRKEPLGGVSRSLEAAVATPEVVASQSLVGVK